MNFETPIVKVCGVRTPEIAKEVIHAGADLIGVNFARISKRRITPDQARTIVRAVREVSIGPDGSPDQATVEPATTAGSDVPTLRVARVSLPETPMLSTRRPWVAGIFVEQSVPQIAEIASIAGLDAIQLSGECTPNVCQAVYEASKLPVVAVIRLSEAVDTMAALAQSLAGVRGVVAILIDAPGAVGGAGLPWDHRMARHVVDTTTARGVPALIAGGLRSENVRQALDSSGAWGADVASGVERDGMTDPDCVRAFISAARAPLNSEVQPFSGAPRVEAAVYSAAQP